MLQAWLSHLPVHLPFIAWDQYKRFGKQLTDSCRVLRKGSICLPALKPADLSMPRDERCK